MPWRVERSEQCPSNTPWGVINEETGAVEGCHATKRDAEQQQAALYASEEGE